ncbi:MAG: tetratricopeptide repeat protein [Nitrososphaera sp.]|jgi:superkiller protein 3
MATRDLLPAVGAEKKLIATNDARFISVKELYTRSYAIVIGISSYKDERLKLKNPVNDAKEVARVLKEKHGFDEVQLILDSEATRENLASIFDDKIRSKEVTRDDRLLVYYSGHGDIRASADQQENTYSESFLIPFDAKYGTYSSYLNLDIITRNCRLCSAKHVLLILDSCYSGTALIDRRSPPRPDIVNDEYLKSITNKRSIQAVAATDKSQLALDSGVGLGQLSSSHGAFTGCLLEILDSDFDPDNDGILTASELGQYLVKNVPRNDIPQNPLYGYLPGSEIGDFIFNIYTRPAVKIGSTGAVSEVPVAQSFDEMSPLVKAASEYYARREYERAITFLDRILEINPKHIGSLTRKGISSMKINRIEDARNCFRQVLSLEKDNVEALDYLERLDQLAAKSNPTSEDSPQEKKIPSAGSEMHPKQTIRLYEQGRKLYDEGNSRKAIEFYDKAIEQNPEFAAAWNGKGLALFHQREYQEAISCYNKAIEIKPDYYETYNDKGVLLKELGRIEEAISCYNKAIEIKPDYAKAYNNKGLALNKLGKYMEAIANFQTALKLEPSNLAIRNNYRNSLTKISDTKDKLRVQKTNPYSSDALLRDQIENPTLPKGMSKDERRNTDRLSRGQREKPTLPYEALTAHGTDPSPDALLRDQIENPTLPKGMSKNLPKKKFLR